MPTFQEILEERGHVSAESEKDSLPTLMAEGGASTDPEEPSFADLLAQRGHTPVAPSPADTAPPAPAPTATETGGKKKEDESLIQGMAKTRAALITEGRQLRDDPDFVNHPNAKRMQDDWMKRWTDQHYMEKEEELANTVTFGGELDPAFRNTPQIIRRGEEALSSVGHNAMAYWARLKGDESGANEIIENFNRFREYNRVLDRNSVFGESAGPVVGDVLSSLGTSTFAGAAGGPLAIASMFGIDEFNRSMEEGKELPPKEQAAHAAIKTLVTFGTTLAGGAFANKMNVSGGESVIPMFSNTVSKLFTKTGLTKALTSAGIEGFEEGTQELLGAIEDYRAGVGEGVSNLLDRVLKAATVGSLTGTVTQVGHNFATLDLKTKHMRDLVHGWMDRLPKDGQPTKADPEQNDVVVTPAGDPISKGDLNKEIDALTELENEIDAQFKTGGADELKHLIAERETAVKDVDEDVRGLRDKWLKLKSLGRDNTDPEVANLETRMSILRDHGKEVKAKLKEDKRMLKDWKSEFEGITKTERAFISEEIDRLSKLKELPDGSQELFKKFARDEEEAEKIATKVGSEKGKKAKGTGDKTADKGTPKTAEPKVEGGKKERLVMTLDEAIEHVKNKEKGGESRGGEDKALFDALDKRITRGRQEDLKHIQDVLGLDKKPGRESMATDFAFKEAARLGHDVNAFDNLRAAIAGNRPLNSVEQAGVQMRYVGELDKLTTAGRGLEDPNSSNAEHALNEEQFVQARENVNELIDGWLAASSEAGAALQAQQRVFGTIYDTGKSLLRARRNKGIVGEKLTDKEIKNITEVSEAARAAADKLNGLEKGTKEYDEADHDLHTAMMEHHAALQNMKPSPYGLKGIESINAAMMGYTLSGDLVPLGRQGFLPLLFHPTQSIKNFSAFFKPLTGKSLKDVERKAFVIERAIREMPNFKTLNRDYNVPLIGRDTPYSQAEASGLQRLSQSFGKSKAGKLVQRAPILARLDIAYRTWLNATRYTMADITYNSYKDILDQPGGRKEMEDIQNFMMNASGHTQVSPLGPGGGLVMVAPRWFLSRMAVPLKVIRATTLQSGVKDAILGKKNTQAFITRKAAQGVAGAAIVSYLLEGMASLMLGPENVTVYRWPFHPKFGIMEAGGQAYDLTGGMGWVFRQMNKFQKGGIEAFTEEDDERDADFGQSLGGVLSSRASPVARLGAYAYQSGKPLNEREKMGMAEFAIRSVTPLSAQGVHDAGVSDGVPSATMAGILESFGVGGHPIRKKKSRAKQHFAN